MQELQTHKTSKVKEKFGKQVLVLIIISTIIRFFLASFFEFGNDEVYYWTYAMFPDWSHFDHPPMIGWMIQLFSGNLLLDKEWGIRMPSIILGAFNTYTIFLIGKRIKNELCGFYAAVTYVLSIYAFLLVGIFILPDTPMIFFMLLAYYSFLRSVGSDKIEQEERKWMYLAGVFAGFGMLSKYNAVFVWVGAGIYILLFNRKWLKEISLYLSALISALLFTPVIYWNDKYDWITFTFHGERVDIFESGLRLDRFFTELGGEILYNNPILWGLTIWAVVQCIRKKDVYLKSENTRFILSMSLPIIFLFLGFSLFRSTLPHWNAPGYVMLMPLVGAYLAEKFTRNIRPKTLPWPLKSAMILMIVGLVFACFQVKIGIIHNNQDTKYTELGEYDGTLDLYGWNQIAHDFDSVRNIAIEKGEMTTNAPILSYKWFPLSHLYYYVAEPLGIKALAIGKLVDIHKYAWINYDNGGFQLGMDAWYITTTRDYKDPNTIYDSYFDEIILKDTVQIKRGNHIDKRAFIYELKGLKKIPVSEIPHK